VFRNLEMNSTSEINIPNALICVRRYSLKLYPNKAQLEAIERQAVLHVHLWNAANDQRLQQMRLESQRKAKGDRKYLSYFDQAKEVKDVRAADPEFAAMSADSAALTIKRLDLAWQAFWKGRKAGRDNGPPRFKASKLADTVPFRDAPKGYRIAVAGKGFKLTMKGIPSAVKARGSFPSDVLDYRDMTLMKRDGEWFASIVVKMDARRASGDEILKVKFDLFEEFSVQKAANGGCSADFPPQEESESLLKSEAYVAAGVDAPDSKGDSNVRRSRLAICAGVDAPDLRCDRNASARVFRTDSDAGAFDLRCDSNTDEASLPFCESVDAIQSDGDRRFKRFSLRWKRNKARVAKIQSKEARRRKHDAHVWTTALVKQASSIELTTPKSVKDETKSGRGDARQWGAEVKTKALINRRILSFAPAMTSAMLAYKAAEAGVEFVLHEDEAPVVSIGNDLVQTAKVVRRARRVLRKEMEIAI
jgi:transposase